MKKYVDREVHGQVCRDKEAVHTYCTKPETRIEGPYFYGNKDEGGQGNRNDLWQAKRLIDSGVTPMGLTETMFPEWCRWGAAFDRYHQWRVSRGTFRPTVILVYGSPGTGKSNFWREGFEPREVFIFFLFFSLILSLIFR